VPPEVESTRNVDAEPNGSLHTTMVASTTDSQTSSMQDALSGAGAAGREPAAPAGRLDGRQLRRKRNREAVVDALLDLYGDGNLRPSTEEIAARSGLSPRSVFRYFDDVDDLTRAAISRMERRAVALLPLDADPSALLVVKVRVLVEQRFRLFDAVGSAATVSRLRAPFQPILAARLKDNRALLRRQIETLFAPELVRKGRAGAAASLAAADVICSFEAHQLLVKDQALSPVEARSVMATALEALLGTTS
jgi:AcrR family transcriptional regulator